jgi:hypothetical protein
MEAESTETADSSLETQSILLAASNHDVKTLRTLLRTGSASVQDPETKTTPLHAAVAACEGLQDSGSPARNAPSGATRDTDRNEDRLPSDLKSGVKAGEPAEVGEVKDQTKKKGDGDPVVGEDEEIVTAAQTVRLLLENGAI